MVAGYSERRAELTPRMVAVLEQAAAGRTVDETARQLHLSRSSVTTVRAALCARLGAPNIVAAVYLATSRGELH